jgi:hypothetical protein
MRRLLYLRHLHQIRWEPPAKKIASALALLCGLSAIVYAAVGGGLSGTVTGPNGAAIAGARVVAVSAAQGIQTKASTDAKGAYRFPVLTVGQYDLKVEAPGYKPSVHKLVIHVDDKARLDIVLETDIPLAPATP